MCFGVAGLGVHGFELFGFRALEGVELSGSGFVCGGFRVLAQGSIRLFGGSFLGV